MPVVIFGGSVPAAYDRRRPNIDWIHGANVQGNAVQYFTKWDCEPRSLESVSRWRTREPVGSFVDL